MKARISASYQELRRPQNRPWVLLLAVAVVLSGVLFLEWASTWACTVNLKGWIKARPFFGPLFFPNEPPVWKDRLTSLVPIIGLPVAFLLWHWRDRNVRDQIENARKDVNLKEFVEVQKMAAGLFDEKMDAQAQTDLQIAALHQLTDFLDADNPKSFRRAAFELIWPSDGLSENRVQSNAEWNQFSNGVQKGDYDGYRQYVDGCHEALDRVAKARISIIHDEWQRFFRSGFPLNGRDFSFIQLPIDADLSDLNLSSCRFIGAQLGRVKFDSANLSHAVLDYADASGASFYNANLWGAYLECSGLMNHVQEGVIPRIKPTDLRNADLSCSFIRCSSASNALLQGAKLRVQRDDQINLEDALFDNSTAYGLGWDRFTEQEKIDARHGLRAKGARHVNDAKKAGE
jgi:Pentapeptide repeats (8 copies)